MMLADLLGLCGSPEENPSGRSGWWGEHGIEVSHLHECVTKDKRPGLTFIRYYYPPDWKHPDEVLTTYTKMSPLLYAVVLDELHSLLCV